MGSRARSGLKGAESPRSEAAARWGRLPDAIREAGGVGARTIWRWSSAGLIRTSRVGRVTLFDLSSIRALIEQNANGGAA